MTATKLFTLTSEGFTSYVWQRPVSAGSSIFFIADMDIDCDGSDNRHRDPCYRPETSLRMPDGSSIDSEKVAGIVVPGGLPRMPKLIGKILGCRARATNLLNMRTSWAVVFDTGPTFKDGEGSPELARRLGIDDNPNTGGEDNPVILYELWPGVPAELDGITYRLQ